MRDPKRIKAFCDQLAELWEKNGPDLRFVQLLSCVLGDGVDRFYVEDEDMLLLFQDFFSTHKNRETLDEQLEGPEFKAIWDAMKSELQ